MKKARSIKLKDKYVSNCIVSLKKKSTYTVKESLKKELLASLKVSLKTKKKTYAIPCGQNGPEDLIRIGKLLSKTQSYKDRVSAIQITYFTVLKSLYRLRGSLERYINENYHKHMVGLRVAEKEAFVDIILSDIDDRIDEVEEVKEVSNMVIKNLTDTYFTLKEIREIASALVPFSESKGYKRSV